MAVALLVEHGAGKLLTWVQLPSAARDFLPESTFGADSLLVSIQPPCAFACIGSNTIFLKHKILHSPIGIGSTALAAAVALLR